MSRDLTIRLLGRPQVVTDQRTGFSKVSRRYVVEGPRASKAGIEDATNPLFLSFGTPDEEFSDYLLTDQKLAPAQSIDKAYLVREYTQLQVKHFYEGFRQTNDIIRVTKRFAVIRGENATYGYDTNAWGNHPASGNVNSDNAWDYAPPMVIAGTPSAQGFDFSTVDNSGFTNTPAVPTSYDDDGNVTASTTLKDYLDQNSTGTSGEWLRGGAYVSQMASGLDVWTVEWVSHGPPYWVLGTTSKKSSRSNTVKVVDFDENGLKVEDVGGSTTGAAATKVKTYVSFVVAEDLPENLARISGGSYSSNSSNSVNVDIHVVGQDGGRGWSHRQHITNAIYQSVTNINVKFPAFGGGTVDVGRKRSNDIIFDYDYSTTNPKTVAMFQGQPIARVGGRISYTRSTSSNVFSGTTNFGSTQTKIIPIFSYQSTKLWKVEITYVGN